MIYDAIIIGGGAAGLFCAITAGRRGRRVLVLEHNADVGRKILISGGGRCNFTNVNTTPANFISRNPHFCKSALAGFTPEDFVRLVEKHKIPYYEKKLGQLFCRDSSRAIVEMLVAECRQVKANILTGCKVTAVEPLESPTGTGFRLQTSSGELTGRKLVIACGGLSFPKIGASDFGFRTARQFGMDIIPTRPSLVALVLENQRFRELAGVAADSRVTVGKNAFRENILFTHRGLSGPAILQASNYWEKQNPFRIDLLPDKNIEELLKSCRNRNVLLSNFLSHFLPHRLADRLAEQNFSNRPLNEYPVKKLREFLETIKNWELRFADTEGYDKAEVTLGGVSTDELSSQTMESKRAAGLYFIGEVVDVTGWLGGYNFQWAWASGFATGNSV